MPKGYGYHNTFMAHLADRDMRRLKGYVARRGFLERVLHLGRDLAGIPDSSSLWGMGLAAPSSWSELESLVQRHRRRNQSASQSK